MSALRYDYLPLLTQDESARLDAHYDMLARGCCGSCDRKELIARIVRIAQLEGEIEATRRWAHWNDGVQYVGSCGNTLSAALMELRHELALLEDWEMFA